eukprot:2623026-Pleurochrysis_carterae.AAC.1
MSVLHASGMQNCHRKCLQRRDAQLKSAGVTEVQCITTTDQGRKLPDIIRCKTSTQLTQQEAGMRVQQRTN